MYVKQRLQLYAVISVLSLLLIAPIYRMQRSTASLQQMLSDPFFQFALAGAIMVILASIFTLEILS